MFSGWMVILVMLLALFATLCEAVSKTTSLQWPMLMLVATTGMISASEVGVSCQVSTEPRCTA